MNRASYLVLFSILLVTSSISLRAQTRKADSLRQILKTSIAQDTNRVKALRNLANEIGRNNPDTAIIIAGQALSLSQKLKWKKGETLAEFALGFFNSNKLNYKDALDHFNNVINICETLINWPNQADAKAAKKLKGRALFNIANMYDEQSDYPKALKYLFKCLKIAEETEDKQQNAATLNKIGNVYIVQSDYPKALEYYFKGLKISEETGNKKEVGRTLNCIGAVYQSQADYPKGLEYFLKGLKIAEEIGNKRGVGSILGNIANMYLVQSNYTKAFEYYSKGLKISKDVGDQLLVGTTLCGLASVYKFQADSAVSKGNIAFAKADKYPKALGQYFEGLKLFEEVGNKQNVALTLGNIGSLFTALDKYKEAENHLIRALLISKEIGTKDNEKELRHFLFVLYEKTKRPALALDHYKKFIALRDTIFSQENTKKSMRSEMDHDYEKKKAVTDAEHNMEIQNQKLITDEKNKKQNIVIGSVIAGLVLVMIFAAFVFRSLRTTRKQKKIIELKNTETEHQKKVIEEHQKDILDSIHYAKRIQTSLLPTEKYIKRILAKK